MKYTLVLVAAVVLLAVAGCLSETVYVTQDDAGTDQPGSQDAGSDAQAACGEGIYPCPPYGTEADNVIDNLGFIGWVDDNADQNPLNDAYREWGLDMFYEMGLAGTATYLYVNVSAGWCSACRAENAELRSYYETYRSQGIEFVGLLFQDNAGNPAYKEFVQAWADEYSLPYTVGVDATFKMGRYFSAGDVPGNMVVDLRTMKIVSMENGFNPNIFAALATP